MSRTPAPRTRPAERLHNTEGLTRRRVLKLLLGGGLGMAALGGAAVAQGYGLGVTRHQLALRGLRQPLSVAFLTDLHYGAYIGPGSVRKWVEATQALRPDLILLGGDQLDSRMDTTPAPLLAELGQLRAPLGVYAVWGNHDYGSFGQYQGRQYGPARADWHAKRDELERAFGAAGITMLRNRGVALRDDLYLGGTDDLWRGDLDIRATLAGAGNRTKLLLSHNPDILPQLPPGIAFSLCGHTHGGQVRLPLLGAPVVPSDYGQKYAMGWVSDAHGNPAYVSRGLGMSGLPIRNLCPPEIAFFQLGPGEGD